MLKNKIKHIVIFTLCITISVFTSCEDDNKDPFDIHLDESNTAPYVRIIPQTSIFDVSKLDTEVFKGTLSAPANNVTSWDVSVSRTSGGVTSDVNFLKTVTSFPSEFETSVVEIANALGVDLDELSAGDSIDFSATSTGGDNVTIGFDDLTGNLAGQAEQNQAYEFAVFIGCPESEEPIDIVPGDWVINMTDTFGDGWQPTTGNGGGAGITLTLNDGTVFEIGICTQNETPGYDCTDGTVSGTRIITIPAGLTDADWEWTFNGDFWGEMGYEIITPNGNLVGLRNPAAQADPNIIDDLLLCAQ